MRRLHLLFLKTVRASLRRLLQTNPRPPPPGCWPRSNSRSTRWTPPPAANLWPGLRRQLEAAALLEAEAMPGVAVPFLRFHPTLAMTEGNLAEAADRHRTSLALFQQLREPASEAVVWHQLGMVFEKARQWDEAERHYRESARIKEDQGNLAGAAQTWNNLAVLGMMAGKPDAAELWYRKAIEGFRAGQETINLSKALSNLANLLQTQSGRLTEARQLAEEALAIDQTLDPGAAEIWKIYNILAQIAEQEALGVPPSGGSGGGPAKAGTPNQAREYRRLAREARRNFAGTRHQLRQHAPLIVGTVMAAQDSQQRPVLDEVLKRYTDTSWKEMVAAIHRVVAGERDEEAIQQGQFGNGPIILDAILTGLRDPQTLADLLPSESPAAE